ncbi:MAG: NAD-dependent epimerase/dehydratase family protein [Myxococcota bacterium]
MRVLVTGGAGFIGSHTAEGLLAAGHEVMVLDDLSRGKRENVPAGARLVVAGITTVEAEKAIADFKPEAVHHFAAQMDVRISVANPVLDSDINVGGTVRIALAAVNAGAKVFTMASTGGAIYGEQDRFPADESHACRSDSPYGISKRCGEIYLDYFARKRGLRTVFLRFANVYGPRQDPHGEAGVVAIFSEKMLRGQTPVIFGDGKQTRDYVFVKDVVDANLRALQNETASGPYNIGTSIETDVIELARRIGVHAGFSGSPRHEPGKPGEQRRSVLDVTHARNVLGWAPRVDLDSGLKATVDWFRGRL